MWGCSPLGWSHLFPLLNVTLIWERLFIYSDWWFIHLVMMYLRIQMYLGLVFARLCDKWWEQSVHLGGLQRHVCEYTTEPQCHLWLEATAHHPQALAWWTSALRGTLSGVRQLGLSVPLMLCLRQVTSEKRRQRLPSVAKQRDWWRCEQGHVAVASLIKEKREKKKKNVFSIPKSLQTVFTGHNAISVTAP